MPHYVKIQQNTTAPIGDPDDFRFRKDPYITDYHTKFTKLDQKLGTFSSIRYLKMNEKDAKRNKARCLHYEKNNNYCNVRLGKCIGSSHCTYYKER